MYIYIYTHIRGSIGQVALDKKYIAQMCYLIMPCVCVKRHEHPCCFCFSVEMQHRTALQALMSQVMPNRFDYIYIYMHVCIYIYIYTHMYTCVVISLFCVLLPVIYMFKPSC